MGKTKKKMLFLQKLFCFIVLPNIVGDAGTYSAIPVKHAYAINTCVKK